MFAEHVRCAVPRELRGETHAAAGFGKHPPVRPSLAGRRAEGALAGDAALGVGDRAVFLAPAGGGKQHIGVRRGVGRPAIGHDDERAGGQRTAHAVGAGHAGGRVGAGDPDRLHRTVQQRVEHVHRLEPGAGGDARHTPEAAQAVATRAVHREMRGELVGEAADFPPAHRIRLAGDGERPHAGPADPARRQVAVDDGVHLVGAGGRLVHALRPDGQHPLGAGEPVVEGFHRLGVDAAVRADRLDIRRIGPRGLQRRGEPGGVAPHPALVDAAGLLEMHQQAIEQHDVGVGGQRQMQIGRLGGGGAARVQHHDTGAAGSLRGAQALMQHRMAPGGVAAHQDEQIRLVPVFINAGDEVLAECAHVAGDRGCHAEARIGVDIAAADAAFHQLVGGVVVLGEELAGHIERDAVGAMRGDGRAEPVGDAVERGVPRHGAAVQQRHGQAFGIIQRTRQRGALGTQPAPIGRMRGVAGDVGVRSNDQAAADAAIRAGRVHRRHASTCSHAFVATVGAWSVAAAGAGPKISVSRIAPTSAPV